MNMMKNYDDVIFSQDEDEGLIPELFIVSNVNHEYKMYMNHGEKLNTSIAGTLILQDY